MKSIVRIIRRAVILTIGISVLLLVLNMLLASMVVFKGMKNEQLPEKIIKRLIVTLNYKEGRYSFNAEGESILSEANAWAMCIDSEGRISTSYKLPSDIPKTYSMIDVVKFTRHYLNDYPVYVWQLENQLLVLGYGKKTYAKYQLNVPVQWMETLPQRVIMLVLGNIFVTLMMSIIMWSILTNRAKPLIEGLDDLSKEKPVQLDEKGIFRDVALSLNRASFILQKKDKALKARDEARYNWIAGISHDIRTPLSIILGYASDLKENTEISIQLRKQADLICDQVNKLKILVKDLNLVSMLEYDMQPLNIKKFTIAKIVRHVLAESMNNDFSQKYTFGLILTNEKIMIEGDQKLMIRAVDNLVSNSIKHNPQGCGIQVITGITKDEEKCFISVIDNGGGIDDKRIEMLKDTQYYKRKRDGMYNGHGIGLSMVKKIIEAHHGTTDIQSKIEGGTEVTLILPIATRDIT